MPLETDKSGGFKLQLDEVINSGTYPTVFSRRVPLWSNGVNVEFTEFGVEIIQGHEDLCDTGVAEPIRGLTQTQITGVPTTYFGNLSALYRYVDGGIVEDLTGPSGPYNGVDLAVGLDVATMWSMVTYGDWVFATNGVDKPQVYKTGAAYEDVAGMDILTARIFVVQGPHILAFNTDCCDREFVWCDADNSEDWVAADDNLAGQLEIRELETEIFAAVPIGSRIAVYGKDQMFLINYLSNDLVFGYKPALNGIGAVGSKAVVPVGRRNFGLSTQGFFVTDGLSFEYIDEPAIRHQFRQEADTNQLSQTIGYHHEETNQVRWFIPSITGVSGYLGYSYNYERNVWSLLGDDVIYTAGQERTVYSVPIVGKRDGKLYKESTGNNLPSGAAIPYSLATKGLDLGDADKTKELTSLRVGLTGAGLNLAVGWSETESGAVTYRPEDSYDLLTGGSGFISLPLRTAGRWLHLKFEGAVGGADWEVVSLEIIGRLEGTR